MKNTSAVRSGFKQHKLVYDPVPFAGGSKIAVREMLSLCSDSDTLFTILTNDPVSWEKELNQSNCRIISFSLPQFLQVQTTGLGYWLKQSFLTTIVSTWRVKLAFKRQKISQLIGISGPGVDLSLYLSKFLFKCEVVQLIQGPVAASRSIGLSLTKAHRVFYLSSAKSSIISALKRHFIETKLDEQSAFDFANFQLLGNKFERFDNGLNDKRWPTPCEYLETQIFWAASLLKWKGLDLLIESNTIINQQLNIPHHICFIRPENTETPVVQAPQSGRGLNWYEKPSNLDEIRSRCSIYISTSQNEPFGLSILECLAAGLCVVIPSDNAYWDRILEHDVSCIKYQPSDKNSLAKAILRLAYQPAQIKTIGLAGQKIAQDYTSSKCYKRIVTELLSDSNDDVAFTIVRGM